MPNPGVNAEVSDLAAPWLRNANQRLSKFQARCWEQLQQNQVPPTLILDLLHRIKGVTKPGPEAQAFGEAALGVCRVFMGVSGHMTIRQRKLSFIVMIHFFHCECFKAHAGSQQGHWQICGTLCIMLLCLG